MSRNLLVNISNMIKTLEYVLPQLFRGVQPQVALALAGMPSSYTANNSGNSAPDRFDLKQLLGNGILWAVPKHRRTIEKRLNRKFGHPEYNWKPLKVKTNLRSCNQCGHDHEIGVLCPHCYDKVRQETQQMQDKIKEQIGLAPIEQEVVVLYQGEKGEQPAEMLNGKRIVEMEKPRPMWFTKNLIQKSTQQPATTKEVKPSNLG